MNHLKQTEDLRILLWDIDGTLIRSIRAGGFKAYTVPVLEKVFGTAGTLPEMTVSGMTDLQIVLEALRDEGFTQRDIRRRVRQLRECYLAELERVMASDGAGMFEVLSGVRETLEAVYAHPRYLSTLLTGNVEDAARLKLELVGLAKYFALPGAFGDEANDRRRLPRLAQRRINQYLNLELQPSQFIVIGDTPNDIACARHFGARCVAVATGRTYGVDELQRSQPDALLPDLSDTQLVMQTLASL
jgi:phosphoglycolate phosphatase-like HAD superfamily hydrolase